MRISTASPRSKVDAVRVGLNLAPRPAPPPAPHGTRRVCAGDRLPRRRGSRSFAHPVARWSQRTLLVILCTDRTPAARARVDCGTWPGPERAASFPWPGRHRPQRAPARISDDYPYLSRYQR
jgi:hypothetical protein